MWCGNFVGEETIGFGLELIHRDAQHTSAAFVRTTARTFHHAKITARANCVTRVGQELPNASGLRILRIRLTTLGAAEDRYDALCFTGHQTSPLTKSDPDS